MVYKRGNRIFISKRGTDIDLWFNVFELIIVFTVALVLWDFINGEIKNTTYEKHYLSRDNALLISAIYASPGDIKYDYSEETNKFIFDFKQNRVEVYEPSELIEGIVISYPFAEDKNYGTFSTKLFPKPSSTIIYTRTKNSIGVKN